MLRFDENPAFAKRFQQDVAPQFGALFPQTPGYRAASRSGGYGELDWPNQNATANFLATLNDPAAPRLREYADAPPMRQLAGQMAELYDQKVAAGLTPNPRLPNALRAWFSGGLPALDDLVRRGLAPAVAGAGLYGLYDQQPSLPQGAQ